MKKPKHHQKIQRTFEFVHANEKSNVKHVESLGKSKVARILESAHFDMANFQKKKKVKAQILESAHSPHNSSQRFALFLFSKARSKTRNV